MTMLGLSFFLATIPAQAVTIDDLQISNGFLQASQIDHQLGEYAFEWGFDGTIRVDGRVMPTRFEVDCEATRDSDLMSCEGAVSVARRAIPVTLDYEASTGTVTYDTHATQMAYASNPQLVEGILEVSANWNLALWIRVFGQPTGSVPPQPLLLHPWQRVFTYYGPTIIIDGVNVTAIWQ